jgi:cardiolipin synthase
MAPLLRHLPNLITTLRIVLVVPMCWLIAAGRYDGALLVAALAGVSDALDGFLAKRFGWQSWIGGMLDPLADKLLLDAAFVWLALTGELPEWLAALVVGRDLVIVAGAGAYHALVGRFDAAPSRLSKLTTTAQLILVLAELLRLSGWLALPELPRAALVGLTTLLTLASGLDYIVTWGTRARRALLARTEKMR